jgi:hypothetical protein
MLSSQNTYTSLTTGRVYKCGAGGSPTINSGGFGMNDTGAVLWSGAKALARLLECSHCGLGSFVANACTGVGGVGRSVSVVELGAGFGVPGIVAASLPALPREGDHPSTPAPTVTVQLTDRNTPESMARATSTVQRNCSHAERARIKVQPFDWGMRPLPPDLGAVGRVLLTSAFFFLSLVLPCSRCVMKVCLRGICAILYTR